MKNSYAQWGAFGDVSFKGRFSPSSFSRVRKFSLKAQEVVNGYPMHQFFGEKEQTASITIELNNAFVDITKATKSLERMAKNGINRTLVIGQKIYGNFGITSISESKIETTPSGTITSIEYKIDIVEVR
ncbi:phage tail protein [Aliivibrio salmonicida]|uniref:phage tail protein n=1 Tax=Aliivibrio salmonicida TaxID=40269 RepID=UPI00406CF95C